MIPVSGRLTVRALAAIKALGQLRPGEFAPYDDFGYRYNRAAESMGLRCLDLKELSALIRNLRQAGYVERTGEPRKNVSFGVRATPKALTIIDQIERGLVS